MEKFAKDFVFIRTLPIYNYYKKRQLNQQYAPFAPFAPLFGGRPLKHGQNGHLGQILDFAHIFLSPIFTYPAVIFGIIAWVASEFEHIAP